MILDSTDTCYIISIPSLSDVVLKPFVLSSGEVLNVGDEFIRLGTKKQGQSSAGFAQITLRDGWRQRMEGFFYAPFYNDGEVHEFVLMSALNVNGVNALDGYKSEYAHCFLAYTVIYGNELMFATPSCSSRLIKTDTLVRCNSN